MLRRLSEAMGVSGSEKEIRRILRELAAPYGETWTDAMGNLYVHKAGEGKKVMVCAHMDEVGMFVKGILDDGLLAYTSAGIDSRVCVSKRVVVGAGKIPALRRSICKSARTCKRRSRTMNCSSTSGQRAARMR